MGRRVTAVILAGGKSERFGSDKAFALWEGEPYLARVGKAVRGVSDAVLILVPPGANGVPYANLVPGASVLPDRVPHGGPVAALRGAVDVILTPTVLIVPCDAPGLPPGLARRLVATCEESRKPAVAATSQGPLYTLCALPKTVLAARAPRARRMEDLLEGAEPVKTDAEGLNLNEPRNEAA